MIQAVTKSLHNLFFAINIFPTNGDRIIQSVFNLKGTNLEYENKILAISGHVWSVFFSFTATNKNEQYKINTRMAFFSSVVGFFRLTQLPLVALMCNCCLFSENQRNREPVKLIARVCKS